MCVCVLVFCYQIEGSAAGQLRLMTAQHHAQQHQPPPPPQAALPSKPVTTPPVSSRYLFYKGTIGMEIVTITLKNSMSHK